jgi:putative peptide maturation system protein
MRANAEQIVVDAIAYLTTMHNEDVRPREAQQRLRVLQASYPAAGLELLWEEEPYDGSVHYDLLLRDVDRATISMSYCPDRALPWPLRGVHRFSEANILQVNGRMLTMEEAVTHLDALWNEAPLMQRMVDACLIREELERQPIEIGDDELQDGMDALRRRHRLYTADETADWLSGRGMTHEEFEQLVLGTLRCRKLRARVALQGVDPFFEARRDELDVAVVARLECSGEDRAHRVLDAVTGGAAFVDVVARHVVAAGTRERCEIASLRRRDARDEVDRAAFRASVGDAIGPARCGDVYVVANVLSLRRAELDRDTRDVIEQIVFEEWLAERRRAAQITWHWGRPADAREA